MSELRADFTALRTSATGRYDPVQLRYIESLLCRWEKSRGKRAERLERRLRRSLQAYRAGQPTAAAAPAPEAPSAGTYPGLAALRERLRENGGDTDLPPLEQTLRQQELDLVGAIERRAQAPEGNGLRQEELRAARRFHSALVGLNANRVVAQALEAIPESCGPLNPQRLATRSLATMRDLSPHYLSRFVSYIDTLFWLELADRNDGR